MRKTAEKVKSLFVQRPALLITDPAYQLACLRHAPDMAQIIWEVKRAFAIGVAPTVDNTASSTVYFLKDCDNQIVAVFKQERYTREFAAYRLDHGRFAGIPQTVITTLEHPLWGGKMTGSLQLFIPETVHAINIKRKEQYKISAASVRRIAILDIRIMNEDRHACNLLISHCRSQMIPIDHGFVLSHVNSIHLDWLGWSHAYTHFNEEELSYIARLDPESDRKMLLDERLASEKVSNRVFVVTVLLQRGAARGLTAGDIGLILSRKRISIVRKEMILSRFELLLESIKTINPTNWMLFTRAVYSEVDRTLDAYEETIVKC